MLNLRRHRDVASRAVRRELKPHPSQASSRGSFSAPIAYAKKHCTREAEATPKTSHTQDTLLAKLEPQMLRVVLMMMMKTVEGVCSIAKGEGVAMD